MSDFTVWHASMLMISFLGLAIWVVANIEYKKITKWHQALFLLWVIAWGAPPLTVIYINGVMG